MKYAEACDSVGFSSFKLFTTDNFYFQALIIIIIIIIIIIFIIMDGCFAKNISSLTLNEYSDIGILNILN